MSSISSPTVKSTKATPGYENNPFFVAVNGLELLFKKAQSIGILLAVMVGLSALSSLPSLLVPPTEPDTLTSQSAQEAKAEEDFKKIAEAPIQFWLIIALIILVVLAISLAIGFIISGVIDYTAAQLARGKETGISDAFRGVFAGFWGYAWVLTIVGVKIFLWSLLFLIPGIIMTVRYSLAGVTYFDMKLKGNAAVKESARLTKGAWLTTFASQSLFNLVTIGIIQPLLVPGTQGVLYRQYRAYDDAHIQKPKAHVLSWLTLVLPLLLVTLILLAVIGFVALYVN